MEHTVGTTNLDGIVMSFTQIGASHVRQEKVNQDSTKHVSLHNENVSILSVSDGHGSSRSFRSQDGSRIAVETAVKVSSDFFRDIP